MPSNDDAEREAIGRLPPGKPLEQKKQRDDPAPAGPTSPGNPEGEDDLGPESGGYDNRPAVPSSDNRKGGYGAG